MSGFYKIRSGGGSSGGYLITVPPEIARALPEDLHYTVELTDDGILYRPVELPPEPTVEVPAWAKRDT